MIKRSSFLKQGLLIGLISLVAFIGLGGHVHAATPYVDDQAHVLKKQTSFFVERKNKGLDKGEIYVVTVKTTGQKPISQAAAQYFAVHHLGKNATLLMYAINDRKVHFQKGSTIGEMFTDKYLGTILTRNVKDDFRNDNYDAGVQLMVSRLADTLNSEESDTSSSSDDDDSSLSDVGVIGVIVVIGIGALISFFTKDDRNDHYHDNRYNDNDSFFDSSDSGSDDSGDTGSW